MAEALGSRGAYSTAGTRASVPTTCHRVGGQNARRRAGRAMPCAGCRVRGSARPWQELRTRRDATASAAGRSDRTLGEIRLTLRLLSQTASDAAGLTRALRFGGSEAARQSLSERVLVSRGRVCSRTERLAGRQGFGLARAERVTRGAARPQNAMTSSQPKPRAQRAMAKVGWEAGIRTPITWSRAPCTGSRRLSFVRFL